MYCRVFWFFAVVIHSRFAANVSRRPPIMYGSRHVPGGQLLLPSHCLLRFVIRGICVVLTGGKLRRVAVDEGCYVSYACVWSSPRSEALITLADYPFSSACGKLARVRDYISRFLGCSLCKTHDLHCIPCVERTDRSCLHVPRLPRRVAQFKIGTPFAKAN